MKILDIEAEVESSWSGILDGTCYECNRTNTGIYASDNYTPLCYDCKVKEAEYKLKKEYQNE